MTNQKTQELGTCRIGPLLWRMAAPAITAQIVNLFYNLVDRMYIGHIKGIGKLALTGVGVTLPIIMIISAFAALVSMGGAPRSSIFLGQGKKEEAEKILGGCTSMLVVISITLTAVFLLFADKLLLLFGASENTLPYALDYILIYCMGTIFVQLTLGLNAFITAQGFSTVSMRTVLIGAISNIILDPIFIFGFHMGVRGAALATIISQGISCVWVLYFLTGKKTSLRIKKEHLRIRPSVVAPCLALGLAPFIMQSTESLLAVCFNSSLLKYGGDMAVGAMTILTSVMQFSMLPLSGLSQGAQPIISYNYGAKNKERVKKAFFLLLACSVTYAVVLWLCAMLMPQMFILLFNSDPALLAFTEKAMRVYMAVSCVFGVQIACQQTIIALGDAKASLFLAILRKILLLIPLIYLLPAILPETLISKTMAVFLAEPVSDFLAVATTAALFSVRFRRALRDMDEPQAQPL